MATPPLPRRFGEYTLLRDLGGAPGELFLARDGAGEICLVRRGLVDPASAREMLGLRHDNLVGVIAVGEVDGYPFVALEYVAGVDLRALWNRCAELRRRIPVDFAIYAVREVCRGLSYIHEVLGLGLMHREIAPGNILIGFDGAVKVTEFGPSRSTRGREITGPGMLMGRASYLSPEEARGEAVDHRADLYAAGVVLWELLTGRQLLAASHRSPASALASARNPNIRPPSEVAPGLPEGLDSAVLGALALAPAQRYPAADRFRARLSEILGRSFPGYDAGRAGAFVRDIFPREVELAEFASPAAQGGPSGRGGIVSSSDTDGNAEGLTPREIAERRRGTVLAHRYRVEDLLSFDGMGALYRVRNLDQGKSCALRVLPGSYTSDPELTTRFLREAQAANNLDHPNIIEVHDLGKLEDASLYSAMELLQGETIAAVLREEGRLSQARAIHIATQVCRALAAAHEAGIIHRDLKPESIVLTAHEGDLDFVKLVDFGICKQVDAGGTASQPGMIIGTPDYMAPEQAAGAEANAASDIYALGCVLFEMLTGQRPYQGRSSLDVLMQKRSKDAPRLVTLAPEVGTPISDIVARCLARRPEDRPESMRELEYELMTAGEQAVRPRGESSLTDLPPPPEAGTLRPTQRPTPVPSTPPPSPSEVAPQRVAPDPTRSVVPPSLQHPLPQPTNAAASGSGSNPGLGLAETENAADRAGRSIVPIALFGAVAVAVVLFVWPGVLRDRGGTTGPDEPTPTTAGKGESDPTPKTSGDPTPKTSGETPPSTTAPPPDPSIGPPDPSEGPSDTTSGGDPGTSTTTTTTSAGAGSEGPPDVVVLVGKLELAIAEERWRAPEDQCAADYAAQIEAADPKNEDLKRIRKQASETLKARAELAAAAKHWHDAVEAYRDLYTLWPDFKAIHKPFGEALQQEAKILRYLKDPVQLGLVADDLLSLNPKNFEAVMMRGEALEGQGLWAEAGEAYAQAKKLKPSEKAVKEAIARVEKRQKAMGVAPH